MIDYTSAAGYGKGVSYHASWITCCYLPSFYTNAKLTAWWQRCMVATN